MAANGPSIEDELRELEPALRNIVRPYVGGYGLELDDLLQRARIGAWRALRRWRPGPKSRRGFALHAAEAQMCTALRDANRHYMAFLRGTVRALTADDGQEIAAVETVAGGADPADVVEHRDRLAELARRINALPPDQRTGVHRWLNRGQRSTVPTRSGAAGLASLAATDTQ
jgi:DNA-directed RNA polymerase specialized sigma24 family protein